VGPAVEANHVLGAFMTIEDLATLTVLRVARAELPSTDAHGLWPCAFCGESYPVHDGWLVDYYHAPTRQTARSYICPVCAAHATDHLDASRPNN
jgi:hypothetical protein